MPLRYLLWRLEMEGTPETTLMWEEQQMAAGCELHKHCQQRRPLWTLVRLSPRLHISAGNAKSVYGWSLAPRLQRRNYWPK